MSLGEPHVRVTGMAIMNAAGVAMGGRQRDGGTDNLVALFDEAAARTPNGPTASVWPSASA